METPKNKAKSSGKPAPKHIAANTKASAGKTPAVNTKAETPKAQPAHSSAPAPASAKAVASIRAAAPAKKAAPAKATAPARAAAPANKAGEKGSNTKKILIASIASVVVIALAAAAVFIFGRGSLFASTEEPASSQVSQIESEPDQTDPVEEIYMPAGMKVSGVDLSGKSLSEAMAALAPVEEAIANTYHDVSVVCGNERITITKEDLGLSFNTEKLLRNLRSRSENEGKAFSGEITPEFTLEGARKKLTELASKTDVAPVNASDVDFNFETLEFSYKDGKEGSKLNINATLLALLDHCKKGTSGSLRAQTDTVPYSAEQEDLLDHFGLMGEAFTYCTNVYNAQCNMGLAMKKMNGAIIEPDGVFSFHGRVGNSTLVSEGWLPAGAWVGGRYVTDEIGGGICQAATTLYHCSLYSGLEVVERHQHLQPSSYCFIGLDATVDYPSLDVKMRNNTKYPIFIISGMDGLELHMQMYGYVTDEWDEIQLGYSQTGSKPVPDPIFEEDASLKDGEYVRERKGLPGYTAIAWREYYKDGKLIRTEDLPDSEYSTVAPLFRIGKKTDKTKIKPGDEKGSAPIEDPSSELSSVDDPSSEAPPDDPSSEVPPDDPSSEAPPDDPSSEAPPDDPFSEVPQDNSELENP